MRLKSGWVTTRVAVVVCIRLPLTPVMVSVYVPAGVVLAVVTDSEDVEVVGLVVKVPFAPVGSPLMLNVTWPENPLLGVTVRL